MKDAKRLKELEKENTELKKIVADQMLNIRVLEAVNAKSGERGTKTPGGEGSGARRPVFEAGRVSLFEAALVQLLLPGKRSG